MKLIHKIKLVFNTVKYLKFTQIKFQIFYRIRKILVGSQQKKTTRKLSIKHPQWQQFLYSNISYYAVDNEFIFLNRSQKFHQDIDWNYSDYGKLWTYNLNYFDFLNQKQISRELGTQLISDFIKKQNFIKDGYEPYPLSLRGINWVKFLSKYKIDNDIINKNLYNDYLTLMKNLEYHILGNHLLENAFSLLFGAYYFRSNKLYSKAKKILTSQLEEQIMNDGAHFELSPMYHQIILHRVLESIHLISLNDFKRDNLLSFLKEKATYMLSWLMQITNKDGSVPMVNDSTYEIATASKDLIEYSKKINIVFNIVPLSDSGYRKIKLDNYELFIDVGNIGPDYQPGHAHSDTFNFELIYKGTPIIVDTGISTYEKNDRRQLERITDSHNTVQIGSNEQSQVWGGFRVANRAKIVEFSESKNKISATHNGYKSIGYLHTRSFQWEEDFIQIRDNISRPTNKKAKAFFHLEAGTDFDIKKNKVFIGDITLKFDGIVSIKVEKYDISKGFNKIKKSQKIIVTFDQYLVTKISL